MPAATLITALPKFISPSEHAELVSSTPEDFASIPPVLRHSQENVKVTLEPPLEGFSGEDGATGTLYVVESVLAFMSATSQKGFQIPYPAITLHAISRGESGPSIYCQLDDEVSAGNGAATATHEEDDEDLPAMSELIIVPSDPASLEPIFEALSVCAALHPDPVDEDDMDDDNDVFIDTDPSTFEVFTGDEGQELSEAGRAALEHLESIIYDPFKTKTDEGATTSAQPGVDDDKKSFTSVAERTTEKTE